VVDIAALLEHSASRATPPDGGVEGETAASAKAKRKVA
jgi:hypothetical protein